MENIVELQKIKKLRDFSFHTLKMNISEEGNRFSLIVTSNDCNTPSIYMTRYVKRIIKDLEKEILIKASDLEEKEFQNIHNAAKREALEFLYGEIAGPFTKETLD